MRFNSKVKEGVAGCSTDRRRRFQVPPDRRRRSGRGRATRRRLVQFPHGDIAAQFADRRGSIPNGKTMVLGDIVLLRPSENAMGRVELLLDSRQAEAADRVEPPVGRFLLGRIMAGGLHGLKRAARPRQLRCGPVHCRQDLARLGPQSAQRWQIDVPAGQRTQIRMHLEDSRQNGRTGDNPNAHRAARAAIEVIYLN